MKSIKLMALAAIVMPVLFSCSGGSSASDCMFGSLPDVYEKFQAEKDQLSEEAKNIKSEADKAKFIEKSEKMQEKWSAKIEESAKALDGKPITLAESDIKVTEPISLEFVDLTSKSDLKPKFKVTGAAEAATEINTEAPYVISSKGVDIVGYNAEGEEVYKVQVGSIPVENVDGKAVVKAGTPVEFSTLYFSGKDIEGYKEAKALKLEVK